MKKHWLHILTALLTFCSVLSPAAEPESVRPNILWITGEDMSAKWLGCYGNQQIQTPNFDKFAADGFLYTHCHAHVPVCAPARSGWITGVHPVSSGTIYMRSLYETPTSWVWYPNSLRANGYFTANHHKTDYNTSTRREPGNGGGENQGSCGHFLETWDSFGKDCWKDPNRKPDQPFFQVLNNAGCHESHLHRKQNTNGNIDPATMKLAAYHPDIPEMRLDYARYTAGVMAADKQLGNILAQLKKDGLEENTIVIYTSDHGGIIGRSKRFLYDSGTHAACIIRIPEKFNHLWPAEKPGSRIDRLVSFIDMPKTWLSITGSAIPAEMQGNIFLGEKKEAPREHLFMARERMDEVPDMQRALRDERYLYIRNYEPFRPNGQYLEYLWLAPSMAAWENFHKSGKTDATTGAFFRPKAVEELFDCQADPDNVKNLATDPAHATRLSQMRETMKKSQTALIDCGFLPEGMLNFRAKKHKKTIYEFVRDAKNHNLTGYMKAADLANFAKPSDLPELTKMLSSDDAAYCYWALYGCILLGKQAATPEVLSLVEKLSTSDIKDEESLDVRATAAFYLCQMDHKKDAALQSLAETILAPGKSAAKGRAWANVFLLGSQAKDIAKHLHLKKIDKINETTLNTFLTRNP